MELTIQQNGTIYTLNFEEQVETALAQQNIPLQRTVDMFEQNADQWILLDAGEEFMLIGEVTLTGTIMESQILIQRLIADVL